MEQGNRHLELAIFDTVRYFSLFRIPLTVTQIWRSLIIDRDGAGVRWHGRPVPHLSAIRETISKSSWLRSQLITAWGYYCWRQAGLSSRQAAVDTLAAESYVRQYLQRHALAQYKWKITKRVAKILAPLPLVRMIGVTGSLALFNTQSTSDLDLFIIVRKGRVWLTRLLLILFTELVGRRRRYWHRQAPDKICLNHYISEDLLLMNPAIQNIYTAMSYQQLVLLYGSETYQKWQQANDVWLKRWLMCPAALDLPSRLTIAVSRLGRIIKRMSESILVELPGDGLEKLAEAIQRYFIAKHAGVGQRGRVTLSNFELAFHPDTKVPQIVRQFREEAGQGELFS